ncbi:MAG: hypothetical protein IPK15_05075 [Verrucomicrobia bacterium]|jgi:uncharacterized protein RhaS with RHS repeats|nr:hypothetical protein [Verrucomicrobiota bacterium]
MKRCDQTLLAVTLFLFIAVSPARAFYNPAAGRWLNRDPIEEKGGKNLCAFAENAPLLKFDPDGKIVITQLKWEKGECGKYTVEWDFKLSNPAPCTGYLVQEVEMSKVVKYCSLKNEVQITDHYWEVWPVTMNDSWSNIARRYGYTDQFANGKYPNSKGSDQKRGVVAFYCARTTDAGDPNDDPANWGSIASSGGLPATRTRPSWWNKVQPVEALEYHWANANWDCCCEKPFSNADRGEMTWPVRQEPYN